MLCSEVYNQVNQPNLGDIKFFKNNKYWNSICLYEVDCEEK